MTINLTGRNFPPISLEDKVVFVTDEFVVLNDYDGHYVNELATVAGRDFFGSYELHLLSQHKPGEGMQPVIMAGEPEVRRATYVEIENAKRVWEEKHHHKLPFIIIRCGEGLGIALPARV